MSQFKGGQRKQRFGDEAQAFFNACFVGWVSLLEQHNINIVMDALEEQFTLEVDHLLLFCGSQCAHQSLKDVGAAVVTEQDPELHSSLTFVICSGEIGIREELIFTTEGLQFLKFSHYPVFPYHCLSALNTVERPHTFRTHFRLILNLLHGDSFKVQYRLPYFPKKTRDGVKSSSQTDFFFFYSPVIKIIYHQRCATPD